MRYAAAVAANALGLLAAVGLAAAAAFHVFTAPGPLERSVSVTVPSGASLRRAAELLKAAGAIESATIFRLGARYKGRDRRIGSGEYKVPAKASMEEILALLAEGRVEQHRLTIPEGMTSHEVVARLKAQTLLTGEVAAVPPEGRVAPDTHFFAKGESRAEVLERMIGMQDAILAKAWEKRRPGLPLESPEELLILASIVQREAGWKEGDIEKVASVFVNRLELGRRLEADATVRYGLTLGRKKLRRGLRQSELGKETPYNTYRISGLPPTPIANPGRAAIKAAANPAETGFLYFVADGTGGHAFSKTYKEHRRNVAAWRRIEKARKSATPAEPKENPAAK